MSFLPISEENQQAPTGATTPSPTGTPPPQGGGSAGAGQTGGGATGASTGSPTQFGSSASKLGDYLTANAPQIQGQADKVAGGLNTQYQGLQNEVAQGGQQFGQQVQGGYAAPNQDIVNQATSNPTQFASDPNNVKGFQAQYNDAYTGPSSYEGSTPYTNIQGEVSKAVQGAGQLGTQAGLQSYLAGTQGGNQTQASNTLDTLLLQGNPGAQQTVQNAAGQFGGLNNQLSQSVTAQDQGVQAAQQAAQNAAQYAQGQFNPVVQNFGDQITQGANTAEAGRTAYNTAQQQNYNQLTPMQQYLQQYLGNSGVTMDNNPLTPYLNMTPVTNPITTANYATPDQYAEAAALQQLGGNGTNVPLNQSNLSQAGTAPNVPTLPGYNMRDLTQNLATNAYQNTMTQGKFPNGEPSSDANWEALLANLQSQDPYQAGPTGGSGIGYGPGITSGPISLYGNINP